MKMVKSLLLASAAGLAAVGGAQAADLPVKAKPVEYVKICSLYGDGFYYIPGTETCVRIGASAQADYWYNALGNGHIMFDGAGGAHDRTTSEHSMKGRGDIGLDSRAQTAYGTLRSVVVLRMDNVDGARSRRTCRARSSSGPASPSATPSHTPTRSAALAAASCGT